MKEHNSLKEYYPNTCENKCLFIGITSLQLTEYMVVRIAKQGRLCRIYQYECLPNQISYYHPMKNILKITIMLIKNNLPVKYVHPIKT